MNKEIAIDEMKKPPIQINILAWFGIVLGSMYLLYSVVNIVLSFLDRTQGGLGDNIVILIYGIPIVAVSVGFRNRQKWGWFGYAAVLALVLALSAFSARDFYGILLGALTLIAFVWVLTPAIRKEYFPS